jgi:hypothetical protein
MIGYRLLDSRQRLVFVQFLAYQYEHQGGLELKYTSTTVCFHVLRSRKASRSALTNTSPTSSSTKLMYAWTNPAALNFGRQMGSHVSAVRNVADVSIVLSSRCRSDLYQHHTGRGQRMSKYLPDGCIECLRGRRRVTICPPAMSRT